MASPRRPELTTAKSAQRLPPPYLFQGPPSRNTSNLSLPSALLPASHGSGKAAVTSQTSSQPSLVRHPSSSRAGPSEAPRLGSPFSRSPHSRRQSEIGGIDAIWEEMQNTLAEVELSAANGAHVFGADHSRALEELRAKQLALAQAWARSETEEVSESAKADGEGTTGGKTAGSGPSRAGSMTSQDDPRKEVEQRTEKDILLARKRREANDRYFDRVNGSVLDVVAKLEEVAEAMRAVERASKEIWTEGESMTSAAESHG